MEGHHTPKGRLEIFCSPNSGRKAREGWSLFTFLAILRTRLQDLNPFFPANVAESNLLLKSHSERVHERRELFGIHTTTYLNADLCSEVIMY